MDKVLKYKNIKLVLGLSVAISVMVHFSGLFEELTTVRNGYDTILYFAFHGLIELFITFFVCMLLFYVNFYFLRPLNSEAKIKGINYFIALVVSFILAWLTTHYLFVLRSVVLDIEMAAQQLYLLFKDFFLAIVVLFSTHIIRIVNQRNKTRLEVRDLKLNLLQRQFDVLKQQISPHFLFNTLNSLKTLIKESPVGAQTYLDHLSSVLRYSLAASEKNLVTLREEMDFVQSYIQLLQLRFSGNISFRIEIDESSLDCMIPPSAIQSLIENAIKHNEISKRNVLNIIIQASGNGSLVVKNNINVKFSPEPGLGLGLSNLSGQFRMLSGQDIAVIKENGFFIVELPLMNLP
jgi:sensor histidine kinase YesM